MAAKRFLGITREGEDLEAMSGLLEESRRPAQQGRISLAGLKD